ncbi:MAG TPA: hypothetical protein VJT33_14735 [bacterium]|nr:hypothetical protein [bacterium]
MIAPGFPIVTKRLYVGLFTITLATLVDEILLTRIFSVTMWYHFAFMAISVALFGMTVGALLVYLCPRYFTPELTYHHLTLSALLFSFSIVLSFLTYASIPFVIGHSLIIVYSMVFMYVAISLPFICSGICVTLALTRFPQQVGRLYAADLAGAATGCVAVIYVLRITDGPGAVLVTAIVAAIGAVLFAKGPADGHLRRTALVASSVLALAAVVQAASAAYQAPLLRLVWVKGAIEDRALYEKWNSFSRIRVSGDPKTLEAPIGWGFSQMLPSDVKVRELDLTIDASTGTRLAALDHGLQSVQYLRYDVTNLVHYLRHDGNVLVMGAGGGRDILSALLFGQKAVTGVEINHAIVAAVNGRFGAFTGHLDRDPRVTFVTDEARAYVARHPGRFDIIQGSFASTWAATAAGAYVLTENSLYTVEAWQLFLGHLTDRGVLTFSRYYFTHRPTEIYRMTALASAALELSGVSNPRSHIIVVRNIPADSGPEIPDGIGTILVSKQPFSAQDLATVERVAREMKFQIVLTPRVALDPTFAGLAAGGDTVRRVVAQYPLNIAAPTDDSPYFFQVVRLRDVFKGMPRQTGHDIINDQAVLTLAILILIVLVLTVAGIIVPLMLTTKKAALEGAGFLFVFFAAIGLGFMFIEISQMQRLILYLGHPTYGLSVVLFALLLSSGLGSRSTQGVSVRQSGGRLVLLLGVLALFGTLTPAVIAHFSAAATMIRISLATVLLFPLGLFMGMAFPLGMSVASPAHSGLTPWLWGLNGATSVCASVVATAIALTAGITATFWTGFACYAIACGAFLLSVRFVAEGRAMTVQPTERRLSAATDVEP